MIRKTDRPLCILKPECGLVVVDTRAAVDLVVLVCSQEAYILLLLLDAKEGVLARC